MSAVHSSRLWPPVRMQSCLIQVQFQLVWETQTVYWFIRQEFSMASRCLFVFFVFLDTYVKQENPDWSSQYSDFSFSRLIVKSYRNLDRNQPKLHEQTLLRWKCCLVSLLLVFVVGLRGSLSKLISLQRPAKNRHPDCSVVHTHRDTHSQRQAGGQTGKHAASQVHVDAHAVHVQRIKKEAVNRFFIHQWVINWGLVNGDSEWTCVDTVLRSSLWTAASMGLDASRRLFKQDELLIRPRFPPGSSL